MQGQVLVDRQVQPGAGGVLQFSVDHYDLAGKTSKRPASSMRNRLS